MSDHLLPIAKIHTDFTEKFGIPRQSGLLETLTSKIILEPKYRNIDALRGIEEFSHLWLLWKFSKTSKKEWSPMVRPPKLGGNKKIGVFASRSPYRPNPIGLSCVRLIKIERTYKQGPVLVVSGADILDKTPIYDIKPYIPYTDSYPNAKGGFSKPFNVTSLKIEYDDKLLDCFSLEKRQALLDLLAQDPRPSYQDDPNREYGFTFAGYEIKFVVKEKTLHITDVI